MPVGMAIWRMTEAGPLPLDFQRLDFEERLEDMIFADPSLVGLNLLVVGRQVPTRWGGYIDLLAVDSEGHLHVLELKRDRTPREVVAQVLDYGSWVQDLTVEEVSELFVERNDSSFADTFVEQFNIPLPDVFNADHRLTIVASELDLASERIIQYLADRYAVPINAVFFRHFSDNGTEYLARSWLLSPEGVETKRPKPPKSSKVRFWNGRDWYVVLGRIDRHNRWDVCRKYGLVSAGGGAFFWKPLKNLQLGHRVFAYVGGAGYVGIGEVIEPIRPFREVTVDAGLLVDQPDIPDWQRHVALTNDPDLSEYAVKVEWIATVDVGAAVKEKGLFASQVPACRMKDERTIEVVTSAFGVLD